MKIRKIAEKVKDILTFYPETRTNDNLLVGIFYKKEFDIDINTTSFADVISNKKLPSIKYIFRTRRKVQEHNPDLVVEKVKEARANKETECINLALDKSV